MIDFTTLQGLTIPEGVVTQITDESGRVIWAVSNNAPVVLQVEKITSDTYAGETTYTGEQFILLDIYPKTNGTVNVTYGGLTKTITDTSGAEEPNAQQVFFGTFNGVTDSVETPASGELTIEGDCIAFGCKRFNYSNKTAKPCRCICGVANFGKVQRIPEYAFGGINLTSDEIKFNQTSITIPSTIKDIGNTAFYGCESLLNVEIVEGGVKTIGDMVFTNCFNLTSITIPKSVTYIGNGAFATIKAATMLSSTPPEINTFTSSDTGEEYACFSKDVLEQIIVPKGCGDTYKTTAGWSIYADYIVEAS